MFGELCRAIGGLRGSVGPLQLFRAVGTLWGALTLYGAMGVFGGSVGQ